MGQLRRPPAAPGSPMPVGRSARSGIPLRRKIAGLPIDDLNRSSLTLLLGEGGQRVGDRDREHRDRFGSVDARWRGSVGGAADVDGRNTLIVLDFFVGNVALPSIQAAL